MIGMVPLLRLGFVAEFTCGAPIQIPREKLQQTVPARVLRITVSKSEISYEFCHSGGSPGNLPLASVEADTDTRFSNSLTFEPLRYTKHASQNWFTPYDQDDAIDRHRLRFQG